MIDTQDPVTLFAETNFRNQRRRFGIKLDDRRRHMYLVGKTGMGKTTLLEQLVFDDINKGNGLGVVDPHGDFAEKILNYIPTSRINDVVYFNPSDIDYPIGFNVLETIDPRHKHLVASGLMGVFKKIWPDVWSARMEYILNNCILALLDFKGSTLLGINRLLVDKDFRKRVIAQIENPVVRTFWTDEYARYSEKFATEAIAPIQNKVGQFLSVSIIRNIVAQVKSTINIREIMDTGKIFIMNLSKGRIGEDSSRLLGGMLITKIQLAAMERVDIPETERRDFFLYVDEFQNFATESFANILSEARKYRLDLIMAHQYIEQLSEEVRPAVFGNVGTMIVFRVGAEDATFLEPEFTPEFLAEDLVNLGKYNVYIKLMIDGVASNPFSAQTFLTEYKPTGNTEKVIKVSRERYAEERLIIEEKIMRWSGMVGGEELPESVEVDANGGAPTVAQKEQNHIYLHEEELETGQHSKRVDDGAYHKAQRSKPTALDGTRYSTTCSCCGKPTDVPFKPDPSRPLYCVECYSKVQEEKRKQLKESGGVKNPDGGMGTSARATPRNTAPAHIASAPVAPVKPREKIIQPSPTGEAKVKVLNTPAPISLQEALRQAPPPVQITRVSPQKSIPTQAPAHKEFRAAPSQEKNMAPQTQQALSSAKKIKQGEIVIFDDV
ncbi:MAG: type IV secretion system DNA-binding domain-containing protein [Candidatus Magasanikbacteria bacterium]|nr:type IV secretion system DNA-binding domain-containing protein [Candidatus Magasanikbacteria bacterium]